MTKKVITIEVTMESTPSTTKILATPMNTTHFVLIIVTSLPSVG